MAEKLILDEESKFIFDNKDIHTKKGVLSKEIINKAKYGDKIKSHRNKPYCVLPVSFLDKYNKIKRGPQIIPLKDIGAIVAETGLSPDWKIVDAGSGSGALALFLAHLVPKGKVYTYDIRDDHIEIVKKNILFLKLKNITVKKLSVYETIPNKNIDLITLDLPEPWLALYNAIISLKSGGHIVSYSPSIPQVTDFVKEVRKHRNLMYLKTIEILQREWEFKQRIIRPRSQAIGHSGFLTVVRKL